MEKIIITKEKATKVFSICNKVIYFHVYFKSERDKAYVKVSAYYCGKRYVAETWADEEMIQAIKGALKGEKIDIEEYNSKEHIAIDGKNIQFDILKENMESNVEVETRDLFINSKNDIYYCFKSQHKNGHINYCIKCSLSLMTYLESANQSQSE